MKGRKLRWSLLHTGLLFVLCAVVMQAVSIASLVYVLGCASDHLAAQCRARTILTTVDEVRHAGVEAAALSALYRAHHDSVTLQKYNKAQQKIWASLSELEEQVAGERTERHLVASLNERIMVAEMVQQNILHDPRQIGTDQFMKGVPTHKLIEQFSSAPNRPLRRVAEIENGRLDRLNRGAQPLQRSIAFALLASTICTLITITIVGLSIWRRIRERLRHVMSNALRFSANKPLGPTLPGNDEIAELDQALANAQKQLKESEHYRQNLLGLVSHELRSPLTAIDVSLCVLLASCDKANARTRELAQHAETRIKNIISIITSLIDLERLESRTLNANASKNSTSLRELFEQSLRTLEMQDELVEREVCLNPRDISLDCEVELATRLVVNLLKICDRKSMKGGVIEVADDGREHTIFSIRYRGEALEGNSIQDFSKLFQCKIEKSAEALDLMLCTALATALGWRIEVSDTTINVRKMSQLADTLKMGVVTDVRRKFRPNIGGKCLILLMVPASFCIIFASMFTAFLHELDVQVAQEQQSWKIIAAASSLTDTVVESAMCSFLFNATGDSFFAKQWSIDKEQLGPKITNMEKVARANSIDITNLGKSIYDILSVHEALFAMPAHTSLDTWLGDVEQQRKLSSGIAGFGGPLAQIALEERAKHDAIASRIERSYELVRRFLILASCTSVLIAFGQVFGLYSGISKRLVRLVDTARSIGTRQKLGEPLRGTDELAELDRVFRLADAKLTEYKNFKSRISNVVSCDLNDDLRRLLDDLETLKRAHTWDQERHQRLENSILDTQRLRRLVSQLLAVESMDGGSFDLQLACTSTEYIVESALQSVTPLAEAADVTLQRFIDHAMLEVDSDRIIQVLINLLSNAVKFSPPESIIRCVCSITEYGAEFSVSDSGKGIPDGFRERIFHKFERGDYDSSGSNSSGSGLGLHICKMIVEQHGGKIEFTSSPQGTTFVVKIPLKRSIAA